MGVQKMGGLMNPGKPTFTRYTDGSMTVDHWPDETRISRVLLAEADQSMVRMAMDGSGVLFAVKNGHADYEVIGYEPLRQEYALRLRYGLVLPDGVIAVEESR